jgi:hypothetical protein
VKERGERERERKRGREREERERDLNFEDLHALRATTFPGR